MKAKVYTFDASLLADEKLYEKYYHQMPDSRRKKIDRIKSIEAKRQSLAAGIVTKQALNGEGIEFNNDSIYYDDNGKPFVKSEKELFISLSHSKERAMCVISQNPVGCDVEKIKKIDKKIANRFFSKKEYEYLEKEDWVDDFFRIWTMKESFLKVTGLGMSMPLDSFEIDLSGGEPVIFQSFDDKIYKLYEEHIDDEYKYSWIERQ